MQSVLLVLGLWLLFGGTHVGLATARVRGELARRLGERAFVWLYLVVASVTFSLLVAGYTAVAQDGPAGLSLGASSATRAPLIAVAVLGIVLIVAALAPTGYWGSPPAILGEGVRPARGLERITRHPYFTGVALWAGAHALLASHLTGTVFFLGFVVLAVGGASHQARKLRTRKGPAFDAYMAQTSAIPFVAILRGVQRFVPKEVPWPTILVGLAFAAFVRARHDGLLDAYGAPLSAAVVGGSIVIGAISTWRSKRQAAAAPEAGE